MVQRFLVLTLVVLVSACSSSSGDDPATGDLATGDTQLDTLLPDASGEDLVVDVPSTEVPVDQELIDPPDENSPDEVLEIVEDTVIPPEDVVPELDVPIEEDLIPEVDQTPEDVVADPFDTTITVKVGETETPVNLSALEQTEFEGKDAIRLTRIVEVAAIAKPFNYHYNFISGDGFNVLVDKMEGDLSKLPWNLELNQGFLFYDAESDILRIGWDASLGFPGSLKVKGMADGIIEAIEVPANQFVVIGGGARSLLTIDGMPTVDIVNYKYPQDGAVPMIPLTDILTAAGVVAPEGLAYKFYGDDGFSNNDDNLTPFENMGHGYYEPTKRRVVFEEEWDTPMCCWSVKNTVLILGIPVL